MTNFSELPIGSRIDDFTVAYRLTSGMNADVFAVWHHKLLAPLVCKRLRGADVADAKWRRLLKYEGSVLKSLSHPNIVRLYGQRHDVEQPYLLFEYVAEKSLRDVLILDGSFSVPHAVRIVQHVGGALDYLHERGYLHRDLKPGNIVLREGRPVLLDFGVVWKWVGARRPPDRAGTPQYLAPEQIRREPLTPATDIYALGVLLYELITNRRPFPPGEPDARSAPLEERYPQLTRPPLLSHDISGASLPPKLLEIITRCLLPRPAERFQNVRDLLEQLDELTDVKIWPPSARTSRSAFGPESI